MSYFVCMCLGARISLANLVSCNVDTLLIVRSTGSKVGDEYMPLTFVSVLLSLW